MWASEVRVSSYKTSTEWDLESMFISTTPGIALSRIFMAASSGVPVHWNFTILIDKKSLPYVKFGCLAFSFGFSSTVSEYVSPSFTIRPITTKR